MSEESLFIMMVVIAVLVALLCVSFWGYVIEEGMP